MSQKMGIEMANKILKNNKYVPEVVAVATMALLSACGGGGSASLPEAKEVSSSGYETYARDDNDYNRVRLNKFSSGDEAILAQFDDSDPSSPEGYKELIQLTDALYKDKMNIEVIAQVSGSGDSEKATRLLRLTADEEPFDNVKNNQYIMTSGKFYFRGQNFAWATIDDGPLLSGKATDGGLVNMVLDFDAQTASLELRTGVDSSSEIRSEITAENLPFNIQTGAYGGDITVKLWNPDSSDIYSVAGNLRGNVGGSATYSNNTHNMTTSGIYTASGTSNGANVTVDGVFFGTDPNAIK